MEISINGYRITVSENYVNRYKNAPALCPVCKGKDTNRCPLQHPLATRKEKIPDPNVWVQFSEDDPFCTIANYYRKTNNNPKDERKNYYRRRDDVRIAQLKLKLKELGISESEFLGVERDVQIKV